MKLRAVGIASTIAIIGFACGPPEGPPDDSSTWVGTITTGGNVTTVVNESGSVWGGTARLVESLNIGMDEGEEPYMFGQVLSMWATDEWIYVVDSQVPAVRVYDHEGRHLRDIGRTGQGPGEDNEFSAVALLPDGRIAVRSYAPGQRINVYTPEGEYLDTWYGDPLFGTDTPPTVTYEGEYFTQTFGVTAEERLEQTVGMGRVGPDGIEGALLRFPRIESPESPRGPRVGRFNYRMPFLPGTRSAMLPSGAMVAGATNRYHLVVGKLAGTGLIIDRAIGAIPVGPEEREWQRRRLVASARRMDPSFNWDGEEMPREHPVFEAIVADDSRRIWVVRPARVTRVADCTDDPLEEAVGTLVPCFQVESVADVFDEDTGKLLGEVELPAGVDLWPSFIQDDEIYTTVEDEAGTIMVKRYRLVLPRDEANPSGR